MKINFLNQEPEVEILDFEKKIGFEIIVIEKSDGYHTYYEAYFDRLMTTIRRKDFEGTPYEKIITTHRVVGYTIDKALKRLAQELSGKRLIYNPNELNEKVIEFPKLVHTKWLNR